MKAKSGFTLVEILIVVVILGILAAIVIPQFTQASTEAKTNSLMSNLQTVRSQIQLYKVQHNDDLPGTVSGVTFADSMTKKTTVTGALDTSGAYGPYLQQIPKEPFTESATVGDSTATTGWCYSSSNGNFWAPYDPNL
jgi:general secretion pathway protein G